MGQIEEAPYAAAEEANEGGLSEDGPLWVGFPSRRKAIRMLLARRQLLLIGVLAGGFAGALWVMLLKPTYTAWATFLPPGSMSSNSSALLGQLSVLSGAGAGAGGGSALGALAGMKDPSMIYIGVLESRSVADEMIRQFGLQAVYKTKKLSAAEKALAGHSKFIPGKDTMVRVEVVDHDPSRAAAMVNAYLATLSKQNDRLALTEAAQRRAFFERQLEAQKDKLADAEVELAKTEEQNGLIQPTGQAQLELMTIGQTRAAISTRQIELESMSQGATDQNPEVIRLRTEIAGLKSQLAQLEDSSAKRSRGDIQVPTAKVPALTLDYVRREREVKYQEAIYELLLRQFEAAKLDESRSAPMIQVVDPAVVPDAKSGPARTLLTLLFAALGGLLAAAWIFGRDAWQRQLALRQTAMKATLS